MMLYSPEYRGAQPLLTQAGFPYGLGDDLKLIGSRGWETQPLFLLPEVVEEYDACTALLLNLDAASVIRLAADAMLALQVNPDAAIQLRLLEGALAALRIALDAEAEVDVQDALVAINSLSEAVAVLTVMGEPTATLGLAGDGGGMIRVDPDAEATFEIREDAVTLLAFEVCIP